MTNILLIGKGYWGKNWYKTLLRRKNDIGTKFSVVDIALKTGTDENGIETYSSLESVPLQKFTHVIVSIGADLHFETVCKLLIYIDSSRILIEKPCGTSFNEACKLTNCFPGFLQIYSPAYQHIKNNLESIGKIVSYKSVRASMGPRIRPGGSVVEDYMIHDLYLLIDLFECYSFKVESSLITNDIVKNSTGDTAQVNLKSMDGKSIHANLFTSWVYPKKERTVIITGTQGSFIWEDDNLYINSSHYFEMDEKYVDSFGNRGYDLRDSSSKYIYTESGKTVMEHELNSFLENKPLSRPLILTETWKLIEAIKQH